MKTYNLSAENGIQRGAPFQLVFRSKDGETPFTGDYAMQLRHSRHDDEAWDLEPDMDEAAGDPPIVRLTLEDTADIEHNLLTGDVEVDGVPQARFVIPVSGEYTVEST